MTCVYKEYEDKIKMVQEQWLQLKIKFYWVVTWKLLFTNGEWNFSEGKDLVGEGRESGPNLEYYGSVLQC